MERYDRVARAGATSPQWIGSNWWGGWRATAGGSSRGAGRDQSRDAEPAPSHSCRVPLNPPGPGTGSVRKRARLRSLFPPAHGPPVRGVVERRLLGTVAQPAPASTSVLQRRFHLSRYWAGTMSSSYPSRVTHAVWPFAAQTWRATGSYTF